MQLMPVARLVLTATQGPRCQPLYRMQLMLPYVGSLVQSPHRNKDLPLVAELLEIYVIYVPILAEVITGCFSGPRSMPWRSV